MECFMAMMGFLIMLICASNYTVLRAITDQLPENLNSPRYYKAI